MNFHELRQFYHNKLSDEIIRIRKDKRKTIEYPNFSDGSSRASVAIGWGIVNRISSKTKKTVLKGQTAGERFEQLTKEFIKQSFNLISHLRPGSWDYTMKTRISAYEQYEHLENVEKLIAENKVLSTAIGSDYIVKPDIIVSRKPVSIIDINDKSIVLSSEENAAIATLTPFISTNRNPSKPILHASISCKWSIRSDRSQNTRTEALNLIRNRKGSLPHIAAVTAEPLPTRLAALALGTGDLDCVYHIALHELKASVLETDNEDQLEMLDMLIEGKRLRDISDLPFDLAV